jgi:uncharacterized membrane protein HdeD (DUF308 family)
MNGVLVQKLWKGKLVAGVLTAILGGMVLAWPGPSILVAATLFGVYLLLSGCADLAVHRRRVIADLGDLVLPALR